MELTISSGLIIIDVISLEQTRDGHLQAFFSGIKYHGFNLKRNGKTSSEIDGESFLVKDMQPTGLLK
jgi:hypothetical protein